MNWIKKLFKKISLLSWFKNRRIGTKLLGSFIFVALLSGLIGFVGVTNIQKCYQLNTELYQQNAVMLQYYSNIAIAFEQNRVNLLNFVQDAEGNESRLDDIEELDAVINDNMAQIAKKKQLPEAERQGLDLLKELINSYREKRKIAINYAQSGQNELAFTMVNKQLQNMENGIDRYFDQLFRDNIAQAEERFKGNAKVVKDSINFTWVVSSICLLIAIVLGMFLTRVISKPVQSLAVAAEGLAQGNVDLEVEINSTDEIGLLGQAFKRMIANIRRQARAVEQIAAGNLDVELVAQSEHDILVKSINRVIGTLKDLIKEVTGLTQSALEGNFEVRGNAGNYQGGYREVVEGINNTLNAVLQPLTYATQYIQKLADGADLEVIDNIYQGEFQTLMNNLNSVRASLHALREETGMLTRAAIAGELTVRGDLQKVNGVYREIIQGINETLDAFVRPLGEAGAVISRMACNDFTQAMSGNYQGMLQQFANEVNLVQEHMLNIQDVLVKAAAGDISRLDEVKQVGKRSENDQLVPALQKMLQTIQDMIEEVNRLTEACLAGNLNLRGDAQRFEGGYRKVIEGFNQTLDAALEPVEEAVAVLQELAQGNMKVSMKGDYRGDHAILKGALNTTIDSINAALGEIHNASQQVAAGAAQVADSSQVLSQGASEQASTMEEIAASITEIAAQTKQNAANANQADKLSATAKDQAIHGNERMQAMLRAMEEINVASANISKIIKVIDEIAFQTNILALNAAVEAARAGQYGKGFAVVAEEVRNLAGRSAQAAKETTELIEGSIQKVGAGTKIANETAAALGQIVAEVTRTTELVEAIAVACNEQATGIAQINQGIEQISQVTQANTATAEQSAAASEELSGQARSLKEAVGRFKIKGIEGTAPRLEMHPDNGGRVAKIPVNQQNDQGRRHRINLEDQEFGKY